MTPATSRAAWTRAPQQLLVLLVRGYRLLLKPWLGNSCRFEPSCSQYALDALKAHGAARGGLLAAGRLLRCHPWCDGGCDAVPAEFSVRGLFTRLEAAPADEASHRQPQKLP